MSRNLDRDSDGNGRGRAAGRPAYSMRALGRADLPATFRLDGTTWRHARTVKHDFFAATGFYETEDGRRAVLKVSRTADFAGVPLAWVGRWLCRRELSFYRRLGDLPNVPAVLGTLGPTGFVHAYVPGRPLSRDRPVPDGFFDALRALFGELHRRGVVYVDTNKPENILLGEDGRPHLIDFQISWDAGGGRLANSPFGRWWMRRLREADLYHVLKHQRRMRPDELTPAELERARVKSRLIRLHRLAVTPWKAFRRRIFDRLRDTGRLLPAGSN